MARDQVRHSSGASGKTYLTKALHRRRGVEPASRGHGSHKATGFRLRGCKAHGQCRRSVKSRGIPTLTEMITDCLTGERLQGLTYQGLDPRYGLDTPAQLEQGRSGVARGYVNEEASR